MPATFQVTLSQMGILLIFMICGYMFRKFRLIDDACGSVLSKLEFLVFLPALYFKTFSANVTVDTIGVRMPYLICGTGVLAMTFVVSAVLVRFFRVEGPTRDTYLYVMTIPNFTYFGFAIISSLYNQNALLNAMIFAIPYNIFIFTFGVYISNPKKEWSPKNLANPAMIAMLVGAVVGLTGLPVPDVLSTAATMAADCMAPVAMLLTGFILAKTPLKTSVSNGKIYIIAALRLVGMPLFGGALLYLLGVDRTMTLIAVLLLSMPAGLNNVILAEVYGGDSTTGAQACFITNFIGVITVPLVLAAASVLLGL